MYTALLHLFCFFSVALLSLNTHFSLNTINLSIFEPFHASNTSVSVGYLQQFTFFIRISQMLYFLGTQFKQIMDFY